MSTSNTRATVAGLPGVETATRFSWPLAERYEVVDGVICPVIDWNLGLKEYGKPLLDPGLFSSLARLSIGGEPSEAKILRWVGKHGLLTNHQGHEAGDPISLEEFKEESRRANRALTLFDAMRIKNYAELRGRITLGPEQAIRPPDRPGAPAPFASALVDGFDSGYTERAGAELADELVLRIAGSALEKLVCPKVELELVFGADFRHPSPLTRLHRPVPAVRPRNLRSAIWFQFALDLAAARPWSICAYCRQPFLVTRRDQTTCPGSAACQKGRQRKEKRPTTAG